MANYFPKGRIHLNIKFQPFDMPTFHKNLISDLLNSAFFMDTLCRNVLNLSRIFFRKSQQILL